MTLDVTYITKDILRTFEGTIVTETQLNQIILAYQSKLRKNTEDVLANLNLGICLYKSGFSEAAERHLKEGLSYIEEYRGSYVLGLICFSKCNFKSAMNWLLKTIELNSEFFPAYTKVSEVFLRLNDIAGAKEYAKYAKKLSCRDSDTAYVLALCYFANGEYQRAVTYFFETLEIDPYLGKAHLNLGHCYTNLGNKEQAVLHYQAASECLEPSCKGFALLYLSLVHFESGDLALSLKCLKDALEKANTIQRTLEAKGYDMLLNEPELVRAIFFYVNQENQEALDLLLRIYKRSRSNPVVCYFLGMAFLRENQLNSALKYFKKVLSQPTHKEFLKLLAQKAKETIEQFKDESEEILNLEEFSSEEATMQPRKVPCTLNVSNFSQLQESPFNSPRNVRKKHSVNKVCPRPARLPSGSEIASPPSSIRRLVSTTDPEPSNCLIF